LLKLCSESVRRVHNVLAHCLSRPLLISCLQRFEDGPVILQDDLWWRRERLGVDAGDLLLDLEAAPDLQEASVPNYFQDHLMEVPVHLGRFDWIPSIHRNPLHHRFEALYLRLQLHELILGGLSHC